VNPNYHFINAAAEEKNPNSCLLYFRKLVQIRKNNPVLVYGKYQLLDKDNPSVYAYTRELDGKKMLILLNFSTAVKQTPVEFPQARMLLSNYNEPVNVYSHPGFELRPYEARIYQLK